MSTPQPNSNSSGQSQPYSQQLAQQYQHNLNQRYPYYAPNVHYAPTSLQSGGTGQASTSSGSQQQPGATAQFLQAGMQARRPSTPYQQTGQSATSYQYPSYGQSAVRTGTPSNSTSATGTASRTGTGTAAAATTTTTTGTTNTTNLPPHLQQYAHYFQNIQNLQNHFPGFNAGTYNYTPTTSYSQTTPTTTPGVNYNAAYPSAYGTAGASYGGANTKARDDDDELMPGMDDADYSAQSQYQSQSKADLKYAINFWVYVCTDLGSRVLLDNFTPEQHERFEAYRRSALNKNSVKKVRVIEGAIK
jgi:transcription initiation factor TFIID subunit 11